jgi:hypothetical protein
VPRTRFLVWRGNTPTPARSPGRSFPPPQWPLPTHPTGHHYTPCQPFLCQIDTACSTQGFRFGGGIPPPLLDLPIPAAYHLNDRFNLTLQVTTSMTASTSPYRSSPHSPPTISMPDRYCVLHTGFSVWRGIPPPLLDLPVPASYHLNDRFSLTLQVHATLSADCFDARSIPSASHSFFSLAADQPCSL